jgi:hypothetical protein
VSNLEGTDLWNQVLCSQTRITVILESFPYSWVPLINFFDPDLPGFPLHRVNFLFENRRIFGIPVSYSVEAKSEGNSKLKLYVMSNINLELAENREVRNVFTQKLKERLGFSHAQTVEARATLKATNGT